MKIVWLLLVSNCGRSFAPSPNLNCTNPESPSHANSTPRLDRCSSRSPRNRRRGHQESFPLQCTELSSFLVNIKDVKQLRAALQVHSNELELLDHDALQQLCETLSIETTDSDLLFAIRDDMDDVAHLRNLLIKQDNWSMLTENEIVRIKQKLGVPEDLALKTEVDKWRAAASNPQSHPGTPCLDCVPSNGDHHSLGYPEYPSNSNRQFENIRLSKSRSPSPENHQRSQQKILPLQYTNVARPYVSCYDQTSLEAQPPSAQRLHCSECTSVTGSCSRSPNPKTSASSYKVARPNESNNDKTQRRPRLPSAQSLHRSGLPSPKRLCPTPDSKIPASDIPNDGSDVIHAFRVRYHLDKEAAKVLWCLATLKQGGVVRAVELVKEVAIHFGYGPETTHLGKTYPHGAFKRYMALMKVVGSQNRMGRHERDVNPLYKALYQAAESEEVAAAIKLNYNVKKQYTNKKNRNAIKNPDIEAFEKRYTLNPGAAKVLLRLATLKQEGVVKPEKLVLETAATYHNNLVIKFENVEYPNGPFSHIYPLRYKFLPKKETIMKGDETNVNPLYKVAESAEVEAAIKLAYHIRCFIAYQNR